MNYKDLLLSDQFVPLLRERLARLMEQDLEALRRDDDDNDDDNDLDQRTTAREREVLGQLWCRQSFGERGSCLGCRI